MWRYRNGADARPSRQARSTHCSAAQPNLTVRSRTGIHECSAKAKHSAEVRTLEREEPPRLAQVEGRTAVATSTPRCTSDSLLPFPKERGPGFRPGPRKIPIRWVGACLQATSDAGIASKLAPTSDYTAPYLRPPDTGASSRGPAPAARLRGARRAQRPPAQGTKSIRTRRNRRAIFEVPT